MWRGCLARVGEADEGGMVASRVRGLSVRIFKGGWQGV